MTKLCLLRHGDYITGQVNGQGPEVDLGLSDAGREQSYQLRKRLELSDEIKADVFLASPERRARETAEVIAPALGRNPEFDSHLEEWRSDDGTIETTAFMAIWKSLSDQQRPYHRFVPGCETRIEFATWVHVALNRILTQHAGSTIVFMTHGGFIQVAFQYFFGYGEAVFQRAYPAAGNTSITCWEKEQGSERWVLRASNDMSHLRVRGHAG